MPNTKGTLIVSVLPKCGYLSAVDGFCLTYYKLRFQFCFMYDGLPTFFLPGDEDIGDIVCFDLLVIARAIEIVFCLGSGGTC